MSYGVQSTWLRTHLRDMKGYVPGEQPGAGAIKLNTNENPYPPSPAVISALSEITGRTLQRYPDPLANKFRDAAAHLNGLSRDEIIVTNGGDELLRLALTTFVDPGRSVGIVTPSYGAYSVMSTIHQASLSCVPLKADWGLACDTAARWNSDGAQLALITNPHAPSGVLFDAETIETLAGAFQGLLLIDEAYVDFVDPDLRYDATNIVARNPNVIILRTLSKGYALAGLRIAYGLANKELVAPMLEKTKDSYNVDAIAQHLGHAAIKESLYAQETWRNIRVERERITQKLEELGFGVERSQANFLLVTPPTSYGSTAKILQRYLKDRNIFVRWFDEDRLRNRLRISIGTPGENDALVNALGDHQALTVDSVE
ncbi:histidinol-phosphate transaminase [Agrobacterium sp. T29]|uniref:histidinol-phosphate transaminase n=1 Tax=Agrobacterium sp. T29 TaxID=2580515 RepID=UPI00115E6A76|nr:histidinol-phosphate transaminase [Agrobacterium sp. T29]